MSSIGIRNARWRTTFPNLAEPQKEEWLLGLLLRCDEVNGWFSGTAATYTARLTTGPHTLGRPALFVVASFFELPLLAERLSVTPAEIFPTTFLLPLQRFTLPYPQPPM